MISSEELSTSIGRNIITSICQAFIEFAIELWKVMNTYKNDDEIKHDYNWLKNNKDRR